MADATPTIISRTEARTAGLKHYFTGVPCKRGHISLRLLANASCGVCNGFLTKNWRLKFPDKARDKNRQWYASNVEAQRSRGRKKRRRSLEKYRDYSRTYNAENLPRLAAIARNRRARQRSNGGKHTANDVAKILLQQKKRCACCRSVLLDKYHVDHIIPLARGGANDRRNLQILCAPCNQSKSARDPIEFMRAQGRLL